MRKLLYSFLFFIFLHSASFGQCTSYPTSFSTSQISTDQSFCIDNTNTITINNVNAQQYVVLNVVKGYNYTFSVNNIWSNSGGSNIEYLGVFNDASSNAYLAGSPSSTSGASVTWTSTLSGKIRVLLLRGYSCSNTGSTATGSITLTLNSLNNTQETQNETATNTWVGHIYNAGGSTPEPFTSANYAGYYNVGSETINEGFGGDGACFPVYSNGVQRASIYTEGFAVRYRMKSTRPEGCYLVTLRGDDGVRLNVDGVRVFDEWKEQSSTEYANVLVYLKGPAAGGSDLIFDYYENGGQNQVSFSIVSFDVNSNSIVAPTPSVVCSGTRPNTIDGSSYLYNNSSVNPTIRYQWQTATSANGPWTDISGATLEDFRPTAITTTTTSIVNYYRRVVSAAASNASTCSWSSNVISITTGVGGTPGAPTSNAATNITCSSFTANWNSTASASGYRIDVARNSNFNAANMVTGYNNLDVGFVTSFNVSGLDPAVTTYYYRVRAYGCNGTANGNSGVITVGMTLPTVTISGTKTVCQNATSPSVTFTNSQNSAITVTYNVNGGNNTTVNVPANGVANVPVATTAIGTFTYNLVSAVYQSAPACTRSLSGSATVTVGIGDNVITYNNGNSNSVCVSVDENQTANFTAPAGTYFNTVSFASYGSPTGSCGTFQINYTCHSGVKSQAFTESSLLGNTGTISFMADNANFDDPCVSTFKAYKAVARYSEPICAGTIPGQILGSLPTGNGTYTYLWEMSTTSSTSGFSAAPGTNNNQNYTPTVAVTANTWFRRTVTSGGSCPNVSAVVLIKVNPTPTLTGATQAAAVCSGSAATINLTGLLANSTSTISYTINNVAQIPITSVVATAGGTASFTTPALTFANNGQTLQITGVTTTSATPNCSASFTRNVTLAVNPTPTLTGATQAAAVCSGSAATINLTGLLAGSTSTIAYTISGVAQTSATSIVASGTGTASFTTPALTSANNGQTLQITGVTTTSATPNCSASFTRNVTLSVNPLPTPTVVKDKDFTCESGGSVTVSNLPANWTINQTGQAIQTLTGTGSSSTISGLVAGNYNFTVTNNTSGCTSNTITININNQTSSTTWNGSNWSNGEPDGSKSAIISSVVPNQPFTIAKPNVDACSLTITVPNGSQVIVPSGVTLTITNAVTSNGRLVFKNNSSLLQTTNVQNSGNIVYERETNIRRFDLTYWSSPVTKAGGFTMHDFSPTTLFDKYFYFNPSSTWVTNMNGTMFMETGNGYSIRGPQEFDTVTPSVFTGTFTGVPNNGDITVAGVINNGVVTMPIIIDKFFLFGNPYPSAIDVDALLDANLNVLGALYFWTHVTPPQKPSGDNTYRYSSNDYVVYTSTGATNVEGGPAAKPFDGFIAAGQAFIAKPKATQIHFNNGMRVGETHNGQFFKTAKSSNVEKNRVWLNITSNEGAFKQILVGYIQGATNNVDFNYDAATVGGNSFVDFYSINETKKLTIQGRALPFDNADVVPLGYKTTVAGNFTIAIDHGDGFFKTQEVYLEDKITGKVINLRNENYTFSTLVGTFTDRFVLKYTNKTLGTGDFENPENSVLVSVKNKVVSITSSKETIKEVNIFDVGAQLVYSKNKVNSSELQITNLHSSDQVLLVKITLENGATITKKAIYSNL